MRRNDGGDAIRNAAEILTQADAALLQAKTSCAADRWQTAEGSAKLSTALKVRDRHRLRRCSQQS
jgi:hypothetical protein